MTSVVEKSPSKSLVLQVQDNKPPQQDFSSISDKVSG